MHLGCTMASGHYIADFNFPCGSIDCCEMHMYKNVLLRNANDNSVEEKRQLEKILSSSFEGEDTWLECNDENIRPISTKEFVDLLGSKPNSSSTPYLLFYTRL
ncbi:unnamed protein product [Phaedon cochleariae]|uniref:USP domain-containing protein n=1 Tax=Phaedon cochleariae TaxID=80249 RepID=A0A9N9X2P2_PHACE|nr:unnamed protein product [Phaedon cochleariae]